MMSYLEAFFVFALLGVVFVLGLFLVSCLWGLVFFVCCLLAPVGLLFCFGVPLALVVCLFRLLSASLVHVIWLIDGCRTCGTPEQNIPD